MSGSFFATLSRDRVTFRENFYKEARKPSSGGKNSWFPYGDVFFGWGLAPWCLDGEIKLARGRIRAKLSRASKTVRVQSSLGVCRKFSFSLQEQMRK
jgi:hypothetical protein